MASPADYAQVGFSLLSARHSYEQAKNMHRYRLQVARARAKYTKGVAYNHAVLAEQEAQDVLRSGRKAQQLLGRKARKATAGIRAGMASSGFTVDGGDAFKLTEDVHRLHKEDEREIRRQTGRRADLLKYRASMLRHGADYNEALAGHDPGGPSWGGYFMGALAGSAGSLINIGKGINMPSLGGGGAPAGHIPTGGSFFRGGMPSYGVAGAR